MDCDSYAPVIGNTAGLMCRDLTSDESRFVCLFVYLFVCLCELVQNGQQLMYCWDSQLYPTQSVLEQVSQYTSIVLLSSNFFHHNLTIAIAVTREEQRWE